MLITGLVLLALVSAVYLFLKHPKFGKLPSGKRLEQILKSPNYRNGRFQNLSYTPDLAEGETVLKVLRKVLFEKDRRNKPKAAIPSQKTDLLALAADENVLVWFGHSSYFMQVEGRKILVDPVFSGAASPVPATTRSFRGSDVYTTDDLPEIDYLFITHDHWDHLDYETVMRLKPKIKTIITGLGTGAHLEYWGFRPEIIIEKDWSETVALPDGFTVHTVPGRHFAGRLFKRNQALWMAFVLQTPKRRIFLGGDSGYDTHFSGIGDDFGPFDLAILECGQYNESWKNIHLMPGEIVLAAQALKAKALLPVHWAKFALALHAWDEPINLAVADAKTANLPLLTPMIGEKMCLDTLTPLKAWWRNVD
ncbi:MBL fold metallo-hydrolase [Flavobacterium magnum]|uniref:MBL fold metallo-hydrolase n=1 Tax=Flavobacterium magnum TaxID=2162713 RepID=A0A2S0RG40_9FLAO|nr:MBL fold metallo-hydrolase [Flavobacterium magnum]AWA30260.1 MBL fold metallo-hydrolase [Flavobacterium magnum]